jgi:ribonuclease VapC
LILDSSAIVAIIRREYGYASLVEAMERASKLVISETTLAEANGFLVGHLDVLGRAILSRFLEENRVDVIPFDSCHRSLALGAITRYGSGRHPAALDTADCMTYATARLADLPLLFVGDGFAKTDLTPALA